MPTSVGCRSGDASPELNNVTTGSICESLEKRKKLKESRFERLNFEDCKCYSTVLFKERSPKGWIV